jgi:hypothetical protein
MKWREGGRGRGRKGGRVRACIFFTRASTASPVRNRIVGGASVDCARPAERGPCGHGTWITRLGTSVHSGPTGRISALWSSLTTGVRSLWSDSGHIQSGRTRILRSGPGPMHGCCQDAVSW